MTSILDRPPDESLMINIFRSFGYRVRIDHVYRLHTVTRYDVEVVTGTMPQAFMRTASGVALWLGIDAVRIYPVVGRPGVLAVEVPKSTPTTIDASEPHRLPITIGRGTNGQYIRTDLTTLPHLLVCGTTGSGKSTWINTTLCSLLSLPPTEVRLLLIDPKQVEFTPYDNVPHLVGPVCVTAESTIGRIEDIAVEMDHRYELFRAQGVRDIAAHRAASGSMPYIVVVIDELANLILEHKKAIERPLARLAQMGRAAGIHLILSTQHPIKPVVTGLIRTNVTASLAFAVPDALASRIAIGMNGAESLTGTGDGLWVAPGTRTAVRIQADHTTRTDVERAASRAMVGEYGSPNVDLAEWPTEDDDTLSGTLPAGWLTTGPFTPPGHDWPVATHSGPNGHRPV